MRTENREMASLENQEVTTAKLLGNSHNRGASISGRSQLVLGKLSRLRLAPAEVLAEHWLRSKTWLPHTGLNNYFLIAHSHTL